MYLILCSSQYQLETENSSKWLEERTGTLTNMSYLLLKTGKMQILPLLYVLPSHLKHITVH